MADGGQERTERGADTSTSSFDPLVGARFLGEIQAEGLRAAGDLVDRLVHLVDGPVARFTQDEVRSRAGGSDPAADQVMGAITPWLDLWTDLVRRTSSTMQRFRDTDPVDGGVQLEVDGSVLPSRPLTVHVGPGDTTPAEMWLHNGSGDAYPALAPRCGPLVTADGSTLSATVAFDPPSIESLPARSSRGFLVEVAVDPSVSCGVYRGTVQVRGAPSVWMPIEVAVDVG